MTTTFTNHHEVHAVQHSEQADSTHATTVGGGSAVASPAGDLDRQLEKTHAERRAERAQRAAEPSNTEPLPAEETAVLAAAAPATRGRHTDGIASSAAADFELPATAFADILDPDGSLRDKLRTPRRTRAEKVFLTCAALGALPSVVRETPIRPDDVMPVVVSGWLEVLLPEEEHSRVKVQPFVKGWQEWIAARQAGRNIRADKVSDTLETIHQEILGQAPQPPEWLTHPPKTLPHPPKTLPHPPKTLPQPAADPAAEQPSTTQPAPTSPAPAAPEAEEGAAGAAPSTAGRSPDDPGYIVAAAGSNVFGNLTDVDLGPRSTVSAPPAPPSPLAPAPQRPPRVPRADARGEVLPGMARRVKPPKSARLYYVVALMSMAVSLDTSWRFFEDKLGITDFRERLVMFAVVEVAQVVCGVGMADSIRKPPHQPGPSRYVAWGLAGLSAYIAIDLAGLVGGISRVALGPVLGLVMLHLALGMELRSHTTRTGTWARIGRELRERLLSRLGLADDERDALQRTQERNAREVAKLSISKHAPLRRFRRHRAMARSNLAHDPAMMKVMMAERAVLQNADQLDGDNLKQDSPWIAHAQQRIDRSNHTRQSKSPA
ncbi:hypothetical protein ACQP2U_43110 (plasmid) [Nocardia sp. CA-084685]|uniref:hypothetical protein n=1 Tax=Nocardia sp. CA-084685 TaxID=3239970 RepID=UPI003D96DD29